MSAHPPPGHRLAGLVDHTLLRPEATAAEFRVLCREAVRLGVFAVCVPASQVRTVCATLAELGSPLPVAAVAGFPSGAHRSEVKAAEARLAVADGATEVDVVVDLGAAAEGRWSDVAAEIRAVRAEVPGVLKVILESALFGTADVESACRAAEAAGADFVKTSTGFHPAGGADLADVQTMAETVGGRLGVKASGGIRTREQALAFVAAGATRLGLSASAAVLASELSVGG